MNNTTLEELSVIYKMFGSVPRLKILLELEKKECTVNELVDIVGLSQSAMSHQLKDLKLNNIIKCRKDGMNVLYSLADKCILDIIKIGISHVKGDGCNE